MTLRIGPTRLLHWLLPVLLATGTAIPGAAQTGAAAAVAALPGLDRLAEGWNTLHPGGETGCAHGTDYQFHVRAGDPARLLVFLYGGGGCWDAETCDPERRDTYVSEITPERHPSRLSGILDVDHPENPVRGYSMVAVPVCTGDAHLGDRTETYTLPSGSGAGRQFTIRHRGQVNTLAAVGWIYANFEAPQAIVVAGSSAGAVATPFYASLLAQRYPATDVVGLGDDAGSFGGAALPGADPGRWGIPEVLHRHAGWQGFEGAGSIEQLYITAARSAPNLRLYQFDHAHDETQRFYHELARTTDADVLRHLRTNRAAIRDRVPGFHGFTSGGYLHTVLPRENFYQYRTGGQRLRDWVAAIVAGEAVVSVDCADDCERPGFAYTEQDLRIVERALELISRPGGWNPHDAPGPCRDDADRHTLRCATGQAAREVTGLSPAGTRNIPPPLWDVIYAAAGRQGERRVDGALQRFNNQPDRTAGEVIALLEEVRDRIRTSLATGH
jgi:hypothetical protein